MAWNLRCTGMLLGVLFMDATLSAGQASSQRPGLGHGMVDQDDCEPPVMGSPYIPVDSWVYPAVFRLYSMGYIDNVYLGMRPWTRASLSNILQDIESEIEDAKTYDAPTTHEAQSIYTDLILFLHYDPGMQCLTHLSNIQVESIYTVARGISGASLRDSYHLGSSIINDYGRPYESGFNSYSGASGYASAGRFVAYVRGEFEAAPSSIGYSQALAQALSIVDGTTYRDSTTGVRTFFLPQATIPMGPITATTKGRFIEAFVSAHLLGHEISFGKQDEWLGPGLGGGMAYSNNAENIYSFRINRIEPLDIPLLSRLAGPFRYEFLIGPLRGHDYIPNPENPGGTNPNKQNVINSGNPWVHLEKVSFRPTRNLEFGFERTAIWGGKGHGPITIHSFLKSFLSLASPAGNGKNGRDDPGARFGAFDFSYRLPFVRNWLTLYADSEVHDDLSPIDAPHRASWRPGLFLTHVPGSPKLDLRVEAATTDPSSNRDDASQYGHFMYWETILRQGYTNRGQLFGDWIGREDKGGQAWLTYHLSGNEWVQVGLRNQKATSFFIPGSTTQTVDAGNHGCPLIQGNPVNPDDPATKISCLVPGGTTLNDIDFQVVKHIGKDFEVKGNFALEYWKAPIYLPGQQMVTTTSIQLTWFPDRKVSF